MSDQDPKSGETPSEPPEPVDLADIAADPEAASRLSQYSNAPADRLERRHRRGVNALAAIKPSDGVADVVGRNVLADIKPMDPLADAARYGRNALAEITPVDPLAGAVRYAGRNVLADLVPQTDFEMVKEAMRDPAQDLLATVEWAKHGGIEGAAYDHTERSIIDAGIVDRVVGPMRTVQDRFRDLGLRLTDHTEPLRQTLRRVDLSGLKIDLPESLKRSTYVAGSVPEARTDSYDVEASAERWRSPHTRLQSGSVEGWSNPVMDAWLEREKQAEQDRLEAKEAQERKDRHDASVARWTKAGVIIGAIGLFVTVVISLVGPDAFWRWWLPIQESLFRG